MNPINLDNIPVPGGSGFFDLQRGQTYTLCVSKGLRSSTLRPVGSGADPIIIFTGAREQPAFRVGRGDDARALPGITIIGSPWTYAFEAGQGAKLSVDGARVGGGAGLFHGQGHIRAVLANCVQFEPAYNYIVYSGGIPHDVRVAGESTSFSEDHSGYTELRYCTLDKGSKYMAGARFVAYDQVVVSHCHISDTADQAAPGAVPNSALRVHQGKLFTMDNTVVDGPVFIGPLDEGDGGIKDTGARRKFRELERMESALLTKCTLNTPGGLTVSAGVLSATLDHCGINVKASAIVQVHFPYINRPASVVNLNDCDLVSTGSNAPRIFGGSNEGIAHMKARRGTLNGKAIQ